MIEIQTRALMKWVGIFASTVLYGSLTGISIKVVHSSPVEDANYSMAVVWLYVGVFCPAILLIVYLATYLWKKNPTITLGRKTKLPKMVARKHKDKND